MKVLVLGAGAIGTYLGCKLHASGNDVTLLGRSKLKKLHSTILINKQHFDLPRRIYKFPKEESFDLIFITSKLYDLQNNLKQILKNKVKTKALVSIQNGTVDPEVYEPHLGDSEFTSISIFEGFRLLENQLLVNHSERGWKTEDNKLGKNISQVLKKAKINCTTEKDLERIKAEKLVMNCSVNLLSAIYKKTFYEIYNDVKLKKDMDNLFDESYEVLNRVIKLSPMEKFRKQFYDVISPMSHYSSTYQDALSGRKTEIDFLNGYIIRLAKKFKIKVPTNKKIVKEFRKTYS